MKEITFLTIDDILSLRKDFSVYFSEKLDRQYCDETKLGGALGRPVEYYNYENNDNIYELASLLLIGIIQNHPFTDGNKRTALLAMIMFLFANGIITTFADILTNPARYNEDIITKLENIALKKIGLVEVSTWIENNSATWGEALGELLGKALKNYTFED